MCVYVCVEEEGRGWKCEEAVSLGLRLDKQQLGFTRRQGGWPERTEQRGIGKEKGEVGSTMNCTSGALSESQRPQRGRARTKRGDTGLPERWSLSSPRNSAALVRSGERQRQKEERIESGRKGRTAFSSFSWSNDTHDMF